MIADTKGLGFKRHFTEEGMHPFDKIKWITTTAQVKDKNGEIKFQQEGVEFPDFWEQTAIDVTVEKFFAGALGSKNREISLKQVISGIVDWYKEKGRIDGYFASSKDANIFADELTFLLVNQYGIFNSPVWFNVRVQKEPQVSACYILSADDTMESISENMKIEMDIFRKGSGAGTNHSNLRSSFEEVSAGGTAMGPLLPIAISDKIAKATKSGGKTRRSALMKLLDIDHGDIETFITQKRDVEEAAKILVKYGSGKWDAEFNGSKSVYDLLPFQNFNESVSVFNSFKEALDKDEEWALLERKEVSEIGYHEALQEEHKQTAQGLFVSPDLGKNWFYRVNDLISSRYKKVIKWVKAKDLWNSICEGSWYCGDPALQFIDTINRWHTCKADGKIRSSNPCSEYMFLDDTSCNLASHNLLKFLKKDNTFDVEGFVSATRIFITGMDISVSNASYPTKKIATKTKQYRTLGLGYANLGALLVATGLSYDSEEGRNCAAAITALLLAASYNQSARIAKELGAFERYEVNKESVKEVFDLHQKEIDKLFHKISLDPKSPRFLKIVKEAQSLFPTSNTTVRNAQVTVIAPTGTTGLVLGCDTTGLEPLAGLVIYKKMVGGGLLKLVPLCIEKGLKTLGYGDSRISRILDSIEKGETFTWNSHEDEKVFQTAFGNHNLISSEAHIDMLAAIQPFLSGGASKTANLPENATVEDFSNIFIRAWEKGVKCVAPYRSNSKGSQPLNVSKDAVNQNLSINISHPVKRKLPDDRPGHHHKFRLGGQSGFLNFGFYPDSGELGEMFAEISKGGSTLNGLMNTVAISVSMMLQYGIPPHVISDAYKELKFEPSGITSNPDIRFASSIPDYIGKFIDFLLVSKGQEKVQEEKSNKIDLSGPPCTICHCLTVRNGTCYYCPNCGETTGCS